jgi:hypothetical protein
MDENPYRSTVATPQSDRSTRPESAVPVTSFIAFFGLFVFSLIAGVLPGPADPISGWFFTLIIYPIALIAFGVGVNRGATLTARQRKVTYCAIPLLVILVGLLGYVELLRVIPTLK